MILCLRSAQIRFLKKATGNSLPLLQLFRTEQLHARMTRKPLFLILLSFSAAFLGGAVALGLKPATAPADTPHFHTVLEHQPAAVELRPASNSTAAPDEAASAANLTSLPDFRGAASRALDAVVHVRTAQQVALRQGWSDWGSLFQPSGPVQVQTGSGSGVILDARGYIVTNHHVIEGADVIEIGLNDNRTLQAELVGSDPTTDIAVLKVAPSDLHALKWGDSDAVQVGDWVLAVGNPFDLTSTVTAGIVSAKARDLQLLRPDFDRSLFPVESFIQTDAAVNPGNSGGALVDVSGNLIGINTAIASKTGSYAGYAFAVPSNLAQKVARDLIEYGAVQRAFLGVNITPVDEPLADRLDLPAVEGVLVTGVTSGSGAAAAGMAAGDVILAVAGTPASTVPQLLERVNRFRPGQTAEVQVWRDGRALPIEVQLTARGDWQEDRAAWGAETAPSDAMEGTALMYGCRVGGAENVPSGVVVLAVEPGPFSKAGVQKGTVIQSVNGTPTPDVDAYVRAVETAIREGDVGILIEGVDRTGKAVWYGLDMD